MRYDFTNINEDDLYLADLVLVVGKKKRLTNRFDRGVEQPIFVPAKLDVTLLKIDENLYVDLDDLKDIEYINTCSDEVLKNNNIFLRFTDEIYLGQLLIKNLRKKTVEKKLIFKF